MPDSRPIWFSAFVLVVFCLGGITGWRLGTHWPAPRPEGPGLGAPFGGRGGPGRLGGPPPFGRGPGGPGALPPEIINRLSSELELDWPQREQVRKILDDRRDRFEVVHREARERFDKEQRDLLAAIRLILRPEQQAKFDQFLDRRPGS